jgi:predicted transcriptional regulator
MLMKTKQFARTSPSELANSIGESVTRVTHHVRFLDRAGALRASGTRQVRGTVQHYFELDHDALKAGHKALMALA